MINISIQKKLKTSDGTQNLRVKILTEPCRFIAICGKSGVGKTSLLRMIAGLLTPDEGKIIVNGETWFDSEKKINMPCGERNLGFVFQDYNLFPNMSIRENLRFAFNQKPKEAFIDFLLEKSNLVKVQNLKPSILSGGQKQRAALMRALVKRPKMFLFDEPLSALESNMREEMQNLLLDLFQELQIPFLLVSHDMGEIFRLSEMVYLLEKGEVVKEGSPLEVFAPQDISCKFKFDGIVLSIRKADVVYIVVIKIGNQFIQVISTEEELRGISVGDHVIVGSKAFNPIILKAKES